MSCQSVLTALLLDWHNKTLCLSLQESLCLEEKHWSRNQESLERNKRIRQHVRRLLHINHLLRTPFLPPRMIFIFIYLFLSLFIFVWMWSVYGIIVCGCVHTWRLSWHKVSFSMFLDFSFWDGALSEPETSPAKLDGRKSSSNLTTPTLGEPWANVTMPSFKAGTGESKLGVTELLEWQALYQQSPLFSFYYFETRYYSVAHIGLNSPGSQGWPKDCSNPPVSAERHHTWLLKWA